jgi:cell division protein FtsB
MKSLICLAILLLFGVWIYFFDEFNLRKQSEMKSELKALQEKLKNTEEKIKEYELKNSQIGHNKEVMETIGRDDYYMKRDNEDVYIFLEEDENGELVELE